MSHLLFFLTLLFSFVVSAADLKSVYLTWDNEDTASSIVINVLSTDKIKSIELKYDTSQKYQETAPAPSHRSLSETPIHVYSFSLTRLKPGTTYYFKILTDQNSAKDYKFKTLPSDDSAIEIVSGGDLSPHPDVVTVAQKAVTEKTAVLLLGGDLAYADGDLKKYDRWLKLFELLNQAMLSPDGRLIPMIVAIGNHETIKKKSPNALTKAPFYFTFFPQNNQKSYFKRRLANHTTVFTLDSGHFIPHEGEQTDWLKQSLKEESLVTNKFALYHVPLYPSFRDFEEAGSKAGRDAWLSLFDQYVLTVALENHDHALKRTKMLSGGKVVSRSGTVYAGDGCWAIAPRPAANNRWYLETAQVQKHLWRIVADKNKVSLQAIGKTGKTLDSFTIKNEKVIPYEN